MCRCVGSRIPHTSQVFFYLFFLVLMTTNCRLSLTSIHFHVTRTTCHIMKGSHALVGALFDESTSSAACEPQRDLGVVTSERLLFMQPSVGIVTCLGDVRWINPFDRVEWRASACFGSRVFSDFLLSCSILCYWGNLFTEITLLFYLHVWRWSFWPNRRHSWSRCEKHR